MSVRRHTLTSIIIFGLVAAVLNAGVILDRPYDPGLSGHYTNLVPGEPFHAQIATDFRLLEPATLDGISWVGRYDGPVNLPNPVALTIRLFEDVSGLPAVSPLAQSEVAVSAVPTGSVSLGTRIRHPWPRL